MIIGGAELTEAELRNLSTAPAPIGAYARMAIASLKGHGVKLTADEVARIIGCDHAVQQALITAAEELRGLEP